ncbi:hypothetical protein BU14_0058s0014 [Porphyra umbilicalis]|uniref:Uncharacterized protein n=1 Tax=Porphyra umbilicalis TaxID=2786 RepID=A0A1X6PHG7_PORUM|nr:hypothetical protein BU14_0058s0014 [Porphyra umbilicalis]|eukprot:OSX80103.1 hypothetical protein BU14_0058s0014 [Porphyra umbilicalis]
MKLSIANGADRARGLCIGVGSARRRPSADAASAATAGNAASATSSRHAVAAAPTRAGRAPTPASMAARPPPASTRAPSSAHVGRATTAAPSAVRTHQAAELTDEEAPREGGGGRRRRRAGQGAVGAPAPAPPAGTPSIDVPPPSGPSSAARSKAAEAAAVELVRALLFVCVEAEAVSGWGQPPVEGGRRGSSSSVGTFGGGGGGGGGGAGGDRCRFSSTDGGAAAAESAIQFVTFLVDMCVLTRSTPPLLCATSDVIAGTPSTVELARTRDGHPRQDATVLLLHAWFANQTEKALPSTYPGAAAALGVVRDGPYAAAVGPFLRDAVALCESRTKGVLRLAALRAVLVLLHAEASRYARGAGGGVAGGGGGAPACGGGGGGGGGDGASASPARFWRRRAVAAGVSTGAAAAAATVGATAGGSAAATAAGSGGGGGGRPWVAEVAAVPFRALAPELGPTLWAGGFRSLTAELLGGLTPRIVAAFDASAVGLAEYLAYERLPADKAVALAAHRLSAAAWARAARTLPTPPPTPRTDLVEVIAVASRNRRRDVGVMAREARAAVDALYVRAPHHRGPTLVRLAMAVADAPPAEEGSFGSLLGLVAALLRRWRAAIEAAAADGEAGGAVAAASASDSDFDTNNGEAGDGADAPSVAAADTAAARAFFLSTDRVAVET